ncbi:MAG TPA: SgcJ/EcaC family oxidoreductase [Burkholderiaceae bacterium]|nr:SgcJ/EcaC family oxidoreductase [Burkholderiaceae bacterium]
MIRRYRLAAVAMLLGLAVAKAAASGGAPHAGPSRACAHVTWDGVAGLFDRWNQSLATRDAEQVADNYTRDAVLLPAFANSPRNGREAIRDYYAALLPMAPHARVVQRTIKIRCNLSMDFGVLALRLTDSSGTESIVPAQYSFVYEYRDGRWLVAHEHASVIPKDEPMLGGQATDRRGEP